jgi:hypothetical protein
MFYDKQSNNQVLRMQTLHTGLPVTNEAEELKSVLNLSTLPLGWSTHNLGSDVLRA